VNTRLSLTVPAYNEGGRLGYGLKGLMKWLYLDDAEIIVVDDESTDDTTGSNGSSGSLVSLMTTNHGKGAALQARVIRARGNAVAFVVEMER
jgi:glycosyltransferase involved in cell wall biosynthesis